MRNETWAFLAIVMLAPLARLLYKKLLFDPAVKWAKSLPAGRLRNFLLHPVSDSGGDAQGGGTEKRP
jgi:hypothetical protein